ncbi:MAG: hypothetical protein R2687_02485 [Candidatus Nanopelagicales bacterium]
MTAREVHGVWDQTGSGGHTLMHSTIRQAGGLVRVGQAFGLILDVRGEMRQSREVLACVVSAEQEFSALGQRYADVRLCAAPVAAVAGR